jgi:hypothetical protein
MFITKGESMTITTRIRQSLSDLNYLKAIEQLHTLVDNHLESELLRLTLGIPLHQKTSLEDLSKEYPEEYLWYLCTAQQKDEAKIRLPTMTLNAKKKELWLHYLTNEQQIIPQSLQPQPSYNWKIPYQKIQQADSAHLQRIMILHQLGHPIHHWVNSLLRENTNDIAKMLPFLIHHPDCYSIGLQCTQTLLKKRQKPEMLWKGFQCHFLRSKSPNEALALTRWLLTQKPESAIWMLCILSLQRLQYSVEAEKHLFDGIHQPIYRSVAIEMIKKERQSQLMTLLKETYRG